MKLGVAVSMFYSLTGKNEMSEPMVVEYLNQGLGFAVEDVNEGVEHFRALLVSTLDVRHEMASMTDAGRWQIKRGGLTGQFLNDATQDQFGDSVLGLEMPRGDERPQDAPRRGWPLDNSLVDLPTPRRGMNTAGREA